MKTRYHRALLRELGDHFWNWQPETLYFGGGTPSLMDKTQFREVMELIPRAALTELTMECAPGSITQEMCEHWTECGVNRVSLGVQSFVTGELRQTGRLHTAESVASDIAMLRRAGIENINIDLIAGLPGQNVPSWEKSLDWIERLQPPHVSVYIFEIDEDSRLGKEALLGGLRYGASHLPCDDLTATLYERAVERLRQLDIQRYEISNFARPGRQSLHNRKYWELAPYTGFGVDAHSFDGRERWSNPDDLGLYLQQQENRAPKPKKQPANPLEEHFFVGLRLADGIEPTPTEWTRFAQPIQKWLSTGMLQRSGSRLHLSEAAILVSNEILQDFLGMTPDV